MSDDEALIIHARLQRLWAEIPERETEIEGQEVWLRRYEIEVWRANGSGVDETAAEIVKHKRTIAEKLALIAENREEIARLEAQLREAGIEPPKPRGD